MFRGKVFSQIFNAETSQKVLLFKRQPQKKKVICERLFRTPYLVTSPGQCNLTERCALYYFTNYSGELMICFVLWFQKALARLGRSQTA